MEHGMMIVMNLLLLMLGKPNIKLTPCPGNRIAWPSRKKMGEKKKKKKKLNETLVRKSTHQGAPKREVGWDPLTCSCPVGNGGSFMLVF